MYPLQCKVQNYAWGKPGMKSTVAQLKDKQEKGSVDESLPYAEYWFGTHPNGPSSVVQADGSTVLLSSFLKANSAVAGAAAISDGSLPYLFKVLSVAKALSIQAHPDKKLAEKLHGERPKVYKDPNHKPEMACALTNFEAMCGFRAPAEIAAHLGSVPELRAMTGEEAAAAFEAAVEADTEGVSEARTVAEPVRAALRALFTKVMECEDARTHAEALAVRLAGAAGDGGEAALTGPDAIAYRLTKQYPGDVGVVAPYLLNTLVLKPGEAIFLAANEPHAYLDGDCVEIMACSDNVVRAGLTPKLRDVPTLCSMLTYTAGPAKVLTGDDAAGTPGVRTYSAPVPEFQLERVHLTAGQSTTLPAADSACILLTISGSANATTSTASGDAAGTGAGAGAGAGAGTTTAASSSTLAAGSVQLLAASTPVTLAVDDGAEDVLLFRVHTAPSA